MYAIRSYYAVSVFYRGANRNISDIASINRISRNGEVTVRYSDSNGQPMKTNAVLKDKNNIATVVNFQKTLVDKYKENEDYYNDFDGYNSNTIEFRNYNYDTIENVQIAHGGGDIAMA